MFKKEGFTLIELLIVVIIIGVLAATLIPNLTGRTKEARIKRARSEIFGTILSALDMYDMDFGRYPQNGGTLQLKQLLKDDPPLPRFRNPQEYKDRWNGPYMKRISTNEQGYAIDPWGRPYGYQTRDRGTKYDLCSQGPDPYSPEDDIVSDTGTETDEIVCDFTPSSP